MTLLSPNFFIGTVRIGMVEGASCINFGNNVPNGFESYKKHSQGLGSITGDNNDIEGLRTFLNDRSIMDFLTDPKQTEIPQWVQDLIMQQIKKETIK